MIDYIHAMKVALKPGLTLDCRTPYGRLILTVWFRRADPSAQMFVGQQEFHEWQDQRQTARDVLHWLRVKSCLLPHSEVGKFEWE